MINSLQNYVHKIDLKRLFNRHGEIVVLFFFLVITASASALNPLFLTSANLTNVMRQAAALGVVAIGQTFVILVNGMDLSVGSVATVSGIIAAVMMNGQDEKAFPAILVSILVGTAIGFLIGLTVTKLNIPDFVVTLAFSSIVNGLMFVFTEGREVGAISPNIMSFGLKDYFGIPTTFLIYLVFVAISYVFLRYTRLGRHIYAVGGNKTSARLTGIDVDRVKIFAYMTSGLMASISGLILLTRLAVGYPLAGKDLQLDSVIAVVIGGTSLKGGRGSIIGTLIGAFILCELNNVLNLLGISAFAQIVFKGLIIILVVVMRALGEKKN